MKQKNPPPSKISLRTGFKKKRELFVHFIFLISSICIFSSCQKELSIQESIPEKTEINPAKVYKIPSTPEEKLLVENLVKVTEVFKELYKDKANLKLVNAALFSRAYTDESVLLKDLIFPQNSRLNTVSKFGEYAKKFNVTLNEFSNNFWHEANKTSDQSFLQFLNRLQVKPNNAFQRTFNGDGDGVSIYFPYMEEFEVVPEDGGYYEPITSVVAATSDADEGWGSQPYYINGVFQYYKQVLINDDFAELNPTQIIGINGIEPFGDIGNPVSTAFPPTGPINQPGLPREVKQVYIGDVLCIKQYDALISFTGNGGGSEIVFTRSDGFLKVVDGQVQADNYFTQPKTISRKDIKKERWVDWSMVWDGDWEVNNHQQHFAIFEEDNRNSSEFSGSLSTTIKDIFGIPLTGTIGFKINFKSDDALIVQQKYNRDVFFVLNRIDQEGAMYNGWPVRYKTGPVSFTFNDRTYF